MAPAMSLPKSWLMRHVAFSVVILLVAPFGRAETALFTPPVLGVQAVSAAEVLSQTAVQGTNQAASAGSKPGAVPDNPRIQDGSISQPSASPQSVTPNQQDSTPVGTAAAPDLRPGGAPASRPAGAAIAPAKQSRARSFSIRVALLVGAGIAIGTVAMASLASSSRPH